MRRQEEIIWLREQGFTCVVSLIPSPHNLHNYDEIGVPYLHRPFGPHEDARQVLSELYPEIKEMVAAGQKVVVHQEEVGDRVAGVVAGYIRWTGMVPEGPEAIAIIEQITGRQLGPVGRSLVALAAQLG